MNNTPYIKASEIGEYVYCKRAWWLRRNGLLGDNGQMKEGTSSHNLLNSMLYSHPRLKAIALVLVGIGGLIIILAFLFLNFTKWF